MNAARVTVLLTVWNGMPYLREAVESILRQTDPHFVFLILDNASTDGSSAYLEALTDSRLRVCRLPENIGRTGVLNMGLQLTETPYVAVLDADDVAEPERLARQAVFLDEHPDIALTGSDVRYIDRAGRVIGEDRFPPDHASLRDKLPLYNQFAHAACMFRTEAAKAVGGYPGAFPYAQDFALWLALLREGGRIASIPEFLAKIRIHPAQATRDARQAHARRADAAGLAEAMLAVPGMASASRQAAFFRCAAALWGLGRKREALRRLWRGIAEAPVMLPANPILWRRLVVQLHRRRAVVTGPEA